jgi:hypothetical protein
MIISHSKQFIFVKCRKTASTSLERTLVNHLGSRDIWTPISSPARDGQNYFSYWPLDWLAAKFKTVGDSLGRDCPLFLRYYHDHMAAERIAKLVPREVFQRYYKFCFDRNPWDFAVSLFEHRVGKKRYRYRDFDRFLHEYPIIQNWQLYTSRNQVIVDDVFRYEDLEQMIPVISRRTKIDIEQIIYRDKATFRDRHQSYKSYYTQSSRDLVAARWAQTIKLLGYDF